MVDIVFALSVLTLFVVMVFHRFLFTFSLLALYSPWVSAQPASRKIVPVRYGYFPEARPSHAGCARGWYDYDMPSTNTFYRVTCYPQTSGAYAASRLDNLQLDLASLGSKCRGGKVIRNSRSYDMLFSKAEGV